MQQKAQKAFTFSITTFGKNIHEAVDNAKKTAMSFYDMDIKEQSVKVYGYMKNKFETCPRCGDIDNQAGKQFEVEGTQVWQRITCGSCGCVYNHIYAPADVEILN